MANGNLHPFGRAFIPHIDEPGFVDTLMELHGFDREQATAQRDRLAADEIWLSDEYQVNIDRDAWNGWGVSMTHLSIKRIDKAPMHDWRDLQAIKNRFCGPEAEAIELYPAESRLVDSANQYHLWALPPGVTFPVGWHERYIETESKGGAIQRPFD